MPFLISLISLVLILTPILLASVAILIITLFHWRKHPAFAPVFNFKRPFWVALFISLGMIVLGFAGGALTRPLFHFLKIPYEKLGMQDLTSVAFGLLLLLGQFCSVVSSICCLWNLIAAIFYHIRTKQYNNRDRINIP